MVSRLPPSTEFGTGRHHDSWQQAAKDLVFLTLAALLLFWSGLRVIPPNKIFHDYICYWAAGKIIASGQSPYDVKLQTATQHEYGWDKATDGFGVYEFLPFYYPPWFGFLWLMALPLGFEGARLAWFFLNLEMILATGLLLKRTVPAAPAWAPLLLAPCFLFSVTAVLLGQTTILVFFLLALAWRLLELRWDALAGIVLAWLTIKPQLTVWLLLALWIWLIRQGRWRAVAAVLITGAVFGLVSSLVQPGWLQDMWNAPKETPSPTDYLPWIGNTWLLVLKSLRVSGLALWIGNLAVALPFFGGILYLALKRTTRLADLMGICALAPFFLSPYARHYDFPVLVIPMLILLGNRPSSRALRSLVVILLAAPYLQLFFLAYLKAAYDPHGKFLLECSYFWIPVVCLASWFCTRSVPGTAAADG